MIQGFQIFLTGKAKKRNKLRIKSFKALNCKKKKKAADRGIKDKV